MIIDSPWLVFNSLIIIDHWSPMPMVDDHRCFIPVSSRDAHQGEFVSIGSGTLLFQSCEPENSPASEASSQSLLRFFQICSGNSPIFFKVFSFLGFSWMIWGVEEFSVTDVLMEYPYQHRTVLWSTYHQHGPNLLRHDPTRSLKTILSHFS